MPGGIRGNAALAGRQQDVRPDERFPRFRIDHGARYAPRLAVDLAGQADAGGQRQPYDCVSYHV